MAAREPGLPEPIEPKRAPVGAALVQRHEIPAPTGGDELMRLDEPPAPPVVAYEPLLPGDNPFGPRRGIDETEVAQSIDVTAHCSLRYLEAFSEIGSPPQTMSLKEREQLHARAVGSFGIFPVCHPLRTESVRNGLYRGLDPPPK